MTEQRKSELYNMPYVVNAFSMYLFKSDRKNSKIINSLSVNHLINKQDDRKVSDTSILKQLVNQFSSVVYSCLKDHYIRYNCYMDIGRATQYLNADNQLYKTLDIRQYHFNRKCITIEQFLNDLYDLFMLIYPYSELSIKTVFNDTSIRYFINQWYKQDK